jgi:predicted CopG family antitoxin
MATKTISVSVEAYERLAAARIHERESFSKVICRAVWPPRKGTAEDLLQRIQNRKGRSSGDLQLLDAAQKSDRPATDPWDVE